MKKYFSPAYEAERVETADVICASATISTEEVLDNEGNPTGEMKTVATVSFSALFGNK